MQTMTIGLLVLLFAVCPCKAQSEKVTATAHKLIAQPHTQDWAAIVGANNEFSLALYHKLSDADEGNLLFSPSSIHAALTMTYTGARAKTEEQMHKVLALPSHTRSIHKNTGLRTPSPFSTPFPQERVHKGYVALLKQLKSGDKPGYQLHVANALWGQKGYPWSEEFLSTTRTNYGAGLREVDFSTDTARKTINKWVEEQTKDKIKELLARENMLTRGTCLVLTNAIYFKGDWSSQFDKNATKDATFMLSATDSVEVPMMYQKGAFPYGEDSVAQMLSLPYKGDELSMVVLLPKNANAFAAMVKDLTAEDLSSRIAKLRQREVRVYLPKFRMTWKSDLKETLMTLGMKDAFDPSVADFTGMKDTTKDPRKDLYISIVAHKAFMEVNEEGTEAAAATAVVMARESASIPHSPIFRADHPFLFIIRHNKTGGILFMGHVMNPKE